jgi:RNA polymerase sigma-70 factor (ECF subfamily)
MSAQGSTPDALQVTALAGPLAEPLAGDRAFRRLVEENVDFVWRTLRRLGVPEASADDATQTVLMAASKRRGDIVSGRERAFLYGIVANVAAHVRRSHARAALAGVREGLPQGHTSPEVFDDTPSAEEALHQRQARALLDQVLAEMPVELREVFVLFELEEMTMAQIADMTGIPAGTVASRLRRAREGFQRVAQRLRARIESGGPR